MKIIQMMLFIFCLGLYPLFAVIANGEAKEDGLVYLPWKENIEAAWYDIEIYPARTVFGRLERKPAIYKNRHVFRSGLICPASILTEYKGQGELYWRMRPIDAYGAVMGEWGEGRKLKESVIYLHRKAPIQRPESKTKNLLYPVYSFLRMPGAVSYEVAVYHEKPTEDDTPPDWTERTSVPSVFDEMPRLKKVYWRVRGRDNQGHTVGTWSELYETEGIDANIDVGILGDSITHGGGLMTYGPTDSAYNYTTYLSFPVINMGRSGDTTYDMLNRFDRDVGHFSVKYLLIMGGTNDIRIGMTAESAIRNMNTLKEKCKNAGIIPIFMTIPTMNSQSMQEFYDVEAADGWETERDKLNAWIRNERHIDIASLFDENEPLSPHWAIDGLHPDWQAKEKMGQYIDEQFRKIKRNMA